MVGAGVCHSDYHAVDGHTTNFVSPMILGHEGRRHGCRRRRGCGLVEARRQSDIVSRFHVRTMSELHRGSSLALRDKLHLRCFDARRHDPVPQEWRAHQPSNSNLYRVFDRIGGQMRPRSRGHKSRSSMFNLMRHHHWRRSRRQPCQSPDRIDHGGFWLRRRRTQRRTRWKTRQRGSNHRGRHRRLQTRKSRRNGRHSLRQRLPRKTRSPESSRSQVEVQTMPSRR